VKLFAAPEAGVDRAAHGFDDCDDDAAENMRPSESNDPVLDQDALATTDLDNDLANVA